MPLPVDDRLYRPVRPARRKPRVIFIGYSTMHREQHLLRAKHEFDIGHYAHGLMGDDAARGARRRRRRHQPPRRPASRCRSRTACCCTSPPGTSSSPSRSSRPSAWSRASTSSSSSGRDELSLRLHQIHYQPDAYERVRIRGRDKAEQFRASRVWPRGHRDLFADLAAFGTERELG